MDLWEAQDNEVLDWQGHAMDKDVLKQLALHHACRLRRLTVRCVTVRWCCSGHLPSCWQLVEKGWLGTLLDGWAACEVVVGACLMCTCVQA